MTDVTKLFVVAGEPKGSQPECVCDTGLICLTHQELIGDDPRTVKNLRGSLPADFFP